MQRTEEHDRLARHICQYVRMLDPRMPISDYFRFRDRVFRSSTAVLRQVLEEDAIGDVARRLLPERVGAR